LARRAQLLSGAWSHRNAVVAGGQLQGREGRIGFDGRQGLLAPFLDEQPPARERPRHSGNDFGQQRVWLLGGGGAGGLEYRLALGQPIHRRQGR
jgi:hypothetical protein